MANFLPALPLCDRWEMVGGSSSTRTTGETRQFALDPTEDLDSHYSAGDQFDSDVRRTLADKWERANTDWKLVREDDVFDLGAEVMIPDFAIEHPDGGRAILEIVGFWTPEYLDAKLEDSKGGGRQFRAGCLGATGLCERGVRERRRSSAVVQNGNSRLRCSRFS